MSIIDTLKLTRCRRIRGSKDSAQLRVHRGVNGEITLSIHADVAAKVGLEHGGKVDVWYDEQKHVIMVDINEVDGEYKTKHMRNGRFNILIRELPLSLVPVTAHGKGSKRDGLSFTLLEAGPTELYFVKFSHTPLQVNEKAFLQKERGTIDDAPTASYKKRGRPKKISL